MGAHVCMICITGIPGSGKSTVCSILSGLGYECMNVLDLPGARQCLDGDEMDLDCLLGISRQYVDSSLIIEGHYSHLLRCSMVFILERGENRIADVLSSRKYPGEKIEENIDALRSDTIYQEALELAPASRIHRITVMEGHPFETAEKIVAFMGEAKKD